MENLHREGAKIELLDGGLIFVESRNRYEREEPERIKVYDSDHKYLSYVYDDDEDSYDNLLNGLRECANAVGVMDFLCEPWDAMYHRRFKKFVDVAKFGNEFVNRIGRFYVVVSE